MANARASIATCDKGCKKEFVVKPKMSQLENGIQKTYFKCTHCGKIYTAFYTDPQIRRMQRRQKELGNQLGEEAFKEFTINRGNIKRLMVELKEEMEG